MTRVYVAGSRLLPSLAREAMKAIEMEGWGYHDWLHIDDLRIRGELRNADALAANKRALDESDAVLLVEPARANGRAEAAYGAGRDIPVVVWQAKECLDPNEVDQLHALLVQWNSDKLDQVIGWLRQILEGLKRGREQADAE